MKKILLSVVVGAAAYALATVAYAQAPGYGPDINLDGAKKVAAGAAAEARNNKWTVVIAVVDTHGELVYLERLDDTQVASVNIALGKARTAARFKRPSKALQDALAGGGAGLRVLQLEGAVAVEGGQPIMMDGKIVGAIGVSGVTAEQDGQTARAGAAVVK
jgi:glc operon protein GlcG